MQDREQIREEAKAKILEIQKENAKNFNKKRKEAIGYRPGDLVAIEKTQFGMDMKLRPL